MAAESDSFPEELRYLQPIIRSLARRTPEHVNAELDVARLEAALRKRIRGLDEDAAQAKLEEDGELLKTWLNKFAPSDHPGHWVLACLLYVDAGFLLNPPVPKRGPTMIFEPPKGWNVQAVPFRLDLKRGKLIGSIMAIDEATFTLLQHQREQWAPSPSVRANQEVTAVRFGEVRGKKYLYTQSAPAPWKRVDYVLVVPGGFVTVMLDALGADFEESPFETRAHTLRLVECSEETDGQAPAI
jgi:hypothetical protein